MNASMDPHDRVIAAQARAAARESQATLEEMRDLIADLRSAGIATPMLDRRLSSLEFRALLDSDYAEALSKEVNSFIEFKGL